MVDYDVRTNWRISPIIVAVHAASATQNVTRGMTTSHGSSIACARRRVETVYIPSGKTAPQYSGS